jgi:F0F1-type ATP synthase assembly protein I
MLKPAAFGLIGVGFSLAFWIGGGAFLGHWLDGRFGTDPILTLVLLLLGLGLGCYDAYRRLRDVVTALNKNGRM